MPNTPIFLSKLNRNFPEIAWSFQQKQRVETTGLHLDQIPLAYANMATSPPRF